MAIFRLLQKYTGSYEVKLTPPVLSSECRQERMMSCRRRVHEQKSLAQTSISRACQIRTDFPDFPTGVRYRSIGCTVRSLSHDPSCIGVDLSILNACLALFIPSSSSTLQLSGSTTSPPPPLREA